MLDVRWTRPDRRARPRCRPDSAPNRGPVLMEAVAKAAGNPLFITELVSVLVDDGALTIADGRAEVDEPGAVTRPCD